MKRKSANVFVGLATSACLGMLVFDISAAESDDPLGLFEKLVPVFTHPRCANCHGAVDPHAESGPLADTHDGGIVPDGGTCAESGCHTQTSDADLETRWRLATPQHAFAGKGTEEICALQSQFARDLQSLDDYYKHLDEDFLVDLGFVGTSGGANTTRPPEQPLMAKDLFLRSARAWLDAGAACGKWVGSIEQVENFQSEYEFPSPIAGGTASTTVKETAERKMIIKRKDGVVTTNVSSSGHRTITLVAHIVGKNGPCTLTSVSIF
jgi:hypothetical protein